MCHRGGGIARRCAPATGERGVEEGQATGSRIISHPLIESGHHYCRGKSFRRRGMFSGVMLIAVEPARIRHKQCGIRFSSPAAAIHK